MLKAKDKEKILKGARDKWLITYKRTPVKIGWLITRNNGGHTVGQHIQCSKKKNLFNEEFYIQQSYLSKMKASPDNENLIICWIQTHLTRNTIRSFSSWKQVDPDSNSNPHEQRALVKVIMYYKIVYIYIKYTYIHIYIVSVCVRVCIVRTITYGNIMYLPRTAKGVE